MEVSPQHQPVRLTLQLCAEVWVGDGDKALHSLADIGTLQVSHAVLRRDAVYPVAGDGHHRAQDNVGWILEIVPFLAVEVMTTMPLPPLDM